MKDREREGGNQARGNSFIFRMEIKGVMVKHSPAGYFTGSSVFVSQYSLHRGFT